MLTRHYRLCSIAVLLVLLLSSAPATLAKDKEFKAIVKHLEQKYGARRTKIRFLGLAGFAVKLIRPAGVKGFKLAVFENQDFVRPANEVPFSTVMRSAYTKGWQPLIQANSKRATARTYVYAKEEGKDVKLAIVAFQEREAIVAEVKFNPDAAARFLENPKLLGISLGGGINGGSVLAGLSNGSGSTISNTAPRRRRDYNYSTDLSVLEAGTSETTGSSASDTVTATPASVPPAPSATTQATEITDPSTAQPAPRPELKNAFRAEAGSSAKADEGEAKAVTTGTPAKSEEGTLRVETRLVNLNVRAMTREGQPLKNLNQEDFVIYEDGIKQEVAYFAPVTAPISLVMLLDLSGSTEKKIRDMKEAAKKFVSTIDPESRVAVATFTRRFKLITPFVTDRTQLRLAIDSIEHHGGGTQYYRAMGTSLDLLKDVTDRRKVIVVLTDGMDDSIQGRPDPDVPEYREVMLRIAEEDVTIYPIYFDTENKLGKLSWMFGRGGSSGNVESYRLARRQLEDVAEQTGGLMFSASRAEDLSDAYQQVAMELSQLYSLAYLPDQLKHNGEFRKITVRISREGAVAKTRRGYYDKR